MTGNEAAGRQCILAEAERLFLAHGYHGVSIRDIVQACGLSNAALYYHFGSKQKLFVEVFRVYITRATERVQQAGAGQGSCRQRLAQMAEAHACFVLESRSAMQMLHRDLAELDKAQISKVLPEALKQIPSLFATVLQEGIDAGEVRAVDAQRISSLLLGMVNGLATHRIFGQTTGSLPEDIDLAIRTLFEGIGMPS